MDNAITKPRFQNQSFGGIKKKRRGTPISIREKIGYQIAISVLILLLSAIIKNADTSVTNYISDKITSTITYNFDVGDIPQYSEGVIGKLFGKDDSQIINPNVDSKDNKAVSNEDMPVKGDVGNKTSAVDTTKSTPDSSIAASTDNKSNVSNKTESTVSKEDTSVKSTTEVIHPGVLITPITGTLSGVFGDRVDPLTQKIKPHKGVDIEAANGTEVKAAAAGIVLESAFEKTLGNYVKIEHSNGMYTIYAQCSQLIAKKGQRVNQGDSIAKVGNVGSTLGADLHFEVWKDGKAVNPLEYIKVPEK